MDALGNLITVTEPNPGGGADFVTNYTYNGANQLTQVSMVRPGGTQTRTFQWNGPDLTSATNPENGTVSYTYDNAHRVVSRTDAKNQQTQYSYDAYGRVTQVRHYNASGQEQMDHLDRLGILRIEKDAQPDPPRISAGGWRSRWTALPGRR